MSTAPGAAPTPLDRQRLGEALALATTAIGRTDPNPRVGCVIGWADGRVAGRGATQPPGAAHAEVMALRDAEATGQSVRGATAWVTLEPCAHRGRTGPCAEALVEAGIARCVVTLRDPFPAVAGAGLARMRAAGIDVLLLDAADPLAREAHELNIGFFSRIERGLPWVRAKSAVTLDGRVALPDGRSKWITGPAARTDGQHWRRRASAVLTGIGTVLADDPQMNVRLESTERQPLRIVLDRQLRMPLEATLLRTAGPVLVVAGPETGLGVAAAALRERGVEVWFDGQDNHPPGLTALLRRLAARGINELHLEAGPTLTGAFWADDLIDEWLVYMAPMLLGPGMPMAAGPALADLEAATRYRWHDMQQVGEDLRLRIRRSAGWPESACAAP
ncbi:bifunctional diaminohydroxyphosphoribosylaminopyrimidine deaminase/5-amino-6-(5-phosphoribosylamino)uracil reductase RibD [Rubrivivax rivuli]|uniref:bifunctional diaminohydroxyphosphoribosylaminopyrimidine deaminase/5-amino-6-(5-phosphoribosylamino)uracil reductase RibD n=1 Tax=Rubrivivax rivuli TaxID=1862385 RepID=UPI001FDED86C|nr:bifunctional diaminohydroxyphosphoribosylaminopyrimidine deaminase/5-amino-6-(5-phosphoribosylamino)uracil reductase RibD [Rubrivivax rivuli]